MKLCIKSLVLGMKPSVQIEFIYYYVFILKFLYIIDVVFWINHLLYINLLYK